MSLRERFIVAEVSKTWVDGLEVEPGLICERFDRVININHQRGYRLLSFSLHRLMVRPDELNETIVAVFEDAEPPIAATIRRLAGDLT